MFTGNHLCWSLLLIKLQAIPALYFFEKRLQRRCFPVNIAKFLRVPILKNICKWLLLNLVLFLVAAEFQLLLYFVIGFYFQRFFIYCPPRQITFSFFILSFSFLNCYLDHGGINEEMNCFLRHPHFDKSKSINES